MKAKRDFHSHLFVYLVVNIGLWTIWIIDSIANQWQFPWPIFPTDSRAERPLTPTTRMPGR